MTIHFTPQALLHRNRPAGPRLTTRQLKAMLRKSGQALALSLVLNLAHAPAASAQCDNATFLSNNAAAGQAHLQAVQTTMATYPQFDINNLYCIKKFSQIMNTVSTLISGGNPASMLIQTTLQQALTQVANQACSQLMSSINLPTASTLSQYLKICIPLPPFNLQGKGGLLGLKPPQCSGSLQLSVAPAPSSTATSGAVYQYRW